MRLWSLIKLTFFVVIALCAMYYLRVVMFYIVMYSIWIVGAIALGLLAYVFFKYVKVN